MKEMQQLQDDKVSSTRRKIKTEARLQNLEREHDWFRIEELKLEKIYKEQKKILAQLKMTLETYRGR